MIITFLILSTLLNIGLIWFATKLAKQITGVADDIEGLLDVFEEFSTHIEEVNNMELFYGDPVMKSLLDHSKVIVEDINKYKQIHDLVYDEIETPPEEIKLDNLDV